MQVFANSLSGACLSALIALSFWLAYAPTKTFYFSHAAAITFGAYICYWFTHRLGWSLAAATVMASGCVAMVFCVLDHFVYRYIRHKAPTWSGLVASIGVYVVLQNLISIGFGDETLPLCRHEIVLGWQIGGATLSHGQETIILACIVLLAVTSVLLRITKLGREVRAVACNSDLCILLGIDPNRVTRWAVATGSALAAVAGILSGLDADITPTMGFRLLMNGIIVMIIGGVGSIRGLLAASVLVAVLQNSAAYYLDARWMDAVSFVVLIGFLVWKPLGFAGQRIRKVAV